MFDIKDYLRRAQLIQDSVPLSFSEMAREIGVSYHTLKRIMSDDAAHATISARTMRKIKEFVTKYEGK
jgi:hypothetical protein